MNKTQLPVILTEGNLLLPTEEVLLEIKREESRSAIQNAIDNFDGYIIVASKKPPYKSHEFSFNDLKEGYDFGTIVKVSIRKKWKDNSWTIHALAERAVNIKVKDDNQDLGTLLVEVDDIFAWEQAELATEKVELTALIDGFNQLLTDPVIPKVITDNIFVFAIQLPLLTIQQRYELLSQKTTMDLINVLKNIVTNNKEEKAHLEDEKSANEVERDIQKKLKDKMDKQQKEYYLREKMRIIKEELDEDGEDGESAMDKHRRRLNEEPFPEDIKKKILASIKRLETMQPGSADTNVERNYIEIMMSIPWWEESEDIEDLDFAQQILDKHHYGLKKVKERIIEYLAVKQKTKSLKAPIITLVGPPGVGKTSLASSIAEALGKEFVKISLGGVKDESEIRGHRKTYVGSMPGRIIQAMRRAKVKNPLFLLDEIDKMASDQRGDPASAMLEVLDPEQNVTFSDHYIEEAYDLSKVMFIATANYPEDIPEALYDRMEIINLSSYTEIEKLKIGEEYLIPKILKEHALTEEIKFEKSAIEELIKYYTREAGVRQLERLLSAITRKFIVKLLNKEIETLVVTPEVVNEYLGKRIFDHTEKQNQDNIGVVTGLAYTSFGGDILPIEANIYEGKGDLTLTGKLGEVMRESATIALTYVKSNFAKFGINPDILKDHDVHIHVPEGAVPKDGPSAGITMATTLISALANRPVSKELGMTGEITLRGNVLPIGGLREKSISAARSGLTKIIIPHKNLRDLDEIPDEVKEVLTIVLASTYDEVFAEVFKKSENKS